MKRIVSIVSTAICTVGLSSTAFAAQAVTKQQVTQLMHQTKMLQQQLKSMQRQLSRLERKQREQHQHVTRVRASELKHDVSTKGHYQPMKPVTPAWIYTQGTPVTSSPYLGTHSEFDGSDLIVNVSSINEDLRLLQERQRLVDKLVAHGLPEPKHPLLVVSGKLEPSLSFNKPFVGSSTTDADLGTGELEVAVDMDPWVTGFIGLDYDNSPPAANISRRRIDNSRIFLNKGFVTIGNLRKFPLYTSFGQMYVPFGRYSSNFINAPLTLIMARVNGRGVLIGYHGRNASGPYATVFGIAGDSRTTAVRKINNFGGDIGYSYSSNNFDYDIGMSVIRNMAESDGMQGTGGAIFGGFATPASSEILSHYVPGLDLHSVITAGRYVFLTEYVTALRSFAQNNLMFNNHGAKPKALNFEAAVNFPVLGKPTSLAFGYGWTDQALALNLARRSYGLVLNTSIWKDTIASLEYRHNLNYHAGNVASGTNSTVINAATDASLGKSSDEVTAQFGVYF